MLLRLEEKWDFAFGTMEIRLPGQSSLHLPDYCSVASKLAACLFDIRDASEMIRLLYQLHELVVL